jgi:carboxymethylenebutenolidase
MIFGTKDPHVSEAARETIDRTLQNSGARYNTLLYAAEHAFARDEGPRFDPEVTDLAFAEMICLFRKVFHS